MPVHLGPISRRQFLAGSIAAGAALALRPNLLAAGKRADGDSWALLSDIHLAADRGTIERGINMTGHFQTVRRELLGLARPPVGLFIAGDCAFNSGETGDYAVLADLLRPLRQEQIPIHLALGNHDNRERFWDAFRDERASNRPLRSRQVALLRTPRVNWFILDSLETTQSTPGLLGREQLDWLAQALAAHPTKPALVLVHHNPGINGGNLGLRDTLAFFEVIRPRKQVKAYIYGHTHAWGVQQDFSGIHLVNLPAVSYVFRQGEPAGWIHATLGANGMRLELRCVDPAHKAHGQQVNLGWRT